MPPQSEASVADGGLRQRISAKVAHDAAEQTVFSWKDVAKHNTASDARLIIEGKVYDLTGWVESHPGGSEVLKLMLGRDATHAFLSYHPFTDKPRQILKKFEIGTVKDSEFPQYTPDSGLYKELSKRVGDYFKTNKLNPKDPWPGVWRMIVVSAVLAVSFLATNNFFTLPFWARCLTACVLGICQALPLLHVMHDSSHTAFGSSQPWWAIGGRLFMDFVAGANMTSWHYQHVVGHHIYTNVYTADPDLPVADEGDPRRLVTRQKWQGMYKYQHIYLPPLYGILGLKFRIQDFTDTFFRGWNGPVRVNPISAFGYFELFASKLIWASWRLALPLMYFPIGAKEFWVLFFIAEWMTGYYLAFNFQVSHVSTECDYPLGDEASETIKDEWAVSQIKSSVDYGHYSWITAFLTGALNFQVTHHLFPGISQYHYPAIAEIIKETCKEYKVRYPYLPTFGEAFGAHLRHLKDMGERGVAAEVHMG
ncbi:unnamed protein product [Chrysoparadoxa australica]